MNNKTAQKNSFNNIHFSNNIKLLFTKESDNYYNKNRLNKKLKSLISKERILNNRKIIDFSYAKMFHLFKRGMRKFDEEQVKNKNFYKTLNEENSRFNKEYEKNYSFGSRMVSKKARQNIKSKTFQKFYDKNKLKDTYKEENNLFNFRSL